MIVVPNVVCVAGVFAAGFGIWASVLFNNVTAMAAVANGLWPMRRVAASEAARRKRLSAASAATIVESETTSAAASIPLRDADADDESDAGQLTCVAAGADVSVA
jgi:hypothetical protein